MSLFASSGASLDFFVDCVSVGERMRENSGSRAKEGVVEIALTSSSATIWHVMGADVVFKICVIHSEAPVERPLFPNCNETPGSPQLWR